MKDFEPHIENPKEKEMKKKGYIFVTNIGEQQQDLIDEYKQKKEYVIVDEAYWRNGKLGTKMVAVYRKVKL